jgi:hypothetical protein
VALCSIVAPDSVASLISGEEGLEKSVVEKITSLFEKIRGEILGDIDKSIQSVHQLEESSNNVPSNLLVRWEQLKAFVADDPEVNITI